ncbi:hypothetical protein Barba22A_gp065 [Rheinheimera phage vB_RspM_Barba22A]|jgi:hypothetical protein|uniref:Uncharacterized protein n=85 Tax=Barbavirus TaxID=2733095 RepID=A0A7G9VRU6_9CAUD|nr:hypothetical protein HOV44_gp072 [Rheinheimera phage Barba5S]YP_009822806.1 hypothetical protein HOV45_gp070 [Rheinheimera phage Barba8S]YP_009822942.1 hypothetical protein HOV46_gp065 [Rheinheimera phage vB_RspM_Barba18A]YP_009823088.1 hypothetical protein HOV47_gp075 [Rheinheimera phage vB_RspM_Barba19A]YP_009823223.1 hypothetical protein HOV48_gp067 [Rheinheimera phage Barba21A]QCQ57916.1 hypothetical protein Barba1A_gp065 [Rheinheimera phage vB_RspM_Barba1A]QCQ58052.1 hypothetical prot
MKHKLLTPELKYNNMPFLDDGYSLREDMETLFVGMAFDNLLNCKYGIDLLDTEEDKALYSAYLEVIKSHLTEKEYTDMLIYLENGEI